MQLHFLFVLLCIFNLQIEVSCQIQPSLNGVFNKNTYTLAAKTNFKSNNLFNCKAAIPCNNTEAGVKRFIADKSIIILSAGCNNKTYIIPKEKTLIKDIWSHCCKWGMNPISVESKEEIQCIARAYNKTSGVSNDTSEMYYTAHMDSNMERNFTSCQTGKVTTKDVWAKGQPKNANSIEACTSLKFDGAFTGLYDFECKQTQYPVICEISDEILKPQLEELKKIETKRKLIYSVSAINNFKSNNLEHCGIAVPCNNLEAGSKKFEREGETSGIIMTGCNEKTYFLPEEKTVIQNLWDHCCKWGMYPISLESREEIRCVYKVYTNTSGGSKDPIHEYLTSYLDSNLDRNFTSCKTGQLLASDFWGQKQPDNWNKNEVCIAINLNKKDMGLHDIRCPSDKKHQAICEITAEERKNAIEIMDKKRNALYTPRVIKFFKDKNLLYCEVANNCSNSENLNLNDKNNGIELNGCNEKSYLITAEKGLPSDIWNICCKWGMQPATFTTREEIKCINKAYLSKKGGVRDANHEYFVGYLDASLDRTFINCQTGKSTSYDFWSKYQPDNDKKQEACVTIIFEVSKYGLNDFECDPFDEKQVLCEKLNPELSKNDSLKNLTMNKYVENMNFLNLSNCQSAYCNQTYLKNFQDPSKVGQVLSHVSGNKTFLLTQNKVSYLNIWSECCKCNMVPATVENIDTLSALSKAYKQGATEKTMIFYTSQLDANLNRSFISCVSGNVVPREFFAPGEPDNKNNREACLAIKFDNNNVGLMDVKCDDFNYVLCESIPNMQTFTTPIFTKQKSLHTTKTSTETNHNKSVTNFEQKTKSITSPPIAKKTLRSSSTSNLKSTTKTLKPMLSNIKSFAGSSGKNTTNKIKKS